VRHALNLPPFGTFGDAALLVDLARAAEGSGWDGVFLWDHLHFETDVPFVDAWIALTAIATSTERLRIGPLITPLPRRRPWKVAREAVTLDHLSGGRLVLGVGLGIDFWHEFDGFDEPATDDRIRAELLDDGIEIITRLWSGERVSYAGTRLRVNDIRYLPRPVQQPRIPIWSAVLWPPRANPIRRAARCDGVTPFNPEGMTPEQVVELRGRIDAVRGDAPPYDVCLYGPPARAAEFAAAGVTWYMESLLPDEPLAEVWRIVEEGPPAL
jgi:alkanesulfonate monooxygenase SsuD/methylene tetrahydromethanopterin reductase-like flavin-dependent oxidoreductase (luciferase family)